MDKYKKLMGNTAVFAIGQFSAKLLSFFLVRLYTAALTNAEYSTKDILYNTLNVLVPIVTFSMSDAIIRFGIDKSYDRRKVYTAANLMTVIGMTIFAFFTPIFNMTELYGGYTMLLYAYAYFSCFRSLASQQTRAKGLVRLYAIDGVLTTLTQFIFTLIFMLGLKMGITGYILSFICSDFLSFVFLQVFAGLYKSLDIKFIDKNLIKEMLSYSVPLIPTYLLWWITSFSDRLFVIHYNGADVNGIYSVSHQIPTLVMFVTTIFYQAWQMSSIEEKDSKTLGKFYRSVFGAYSSVLFIAAAGLILICSPLSAILLSGDSYDDAEYYSTILIISMVFQCLCQFLSSIYSVNKKSKNSCLTALSAALTNIILDYILVPKTGPYGAAIATAASYFICFVIRSFDTRRYIHFKIDFVRIAVNTAVIITMSALFITRPKLYILLLILCFLFVLLINFGAILNTLFRILGKRQKVK